MVYFPFKSKSYVKATVKVVPGVKELKGFQKVMLDKGESKTVQFSIKAADLAFYNLDMAYVAEAGEFNLFIGTDSTTSNQARFRLTDTVQLQSAMASH